MLAEDPEGVTAFVTFTVTVLPPNIAPEAVGEIPAQTLRVGDPAVALNLAPFFTDADGDPLTFTTGTADGSILTVDIAGSVVTMTAVAAGETTMTVTATDPRGESAMEKVAVTALPANRPPEAVGSIGRQVLVEGGNPLNIDVAEYFSDPDGDALTYTAESSSTRAVWAEIADGSSTLGAYTPCSWSGSNRDRDSDGWRRGVGHADIHSDCSSGVRACNPNPNDHAGDCGHADPHADARADIKSPSRRQAPRRRQGQRPRRRLRRTMAAGSRWDCSWCSWWWQVEVRRRSLSGGVVVQARRHSRPKRLTGPPVSGLT